MTYWSPSIALRLVSLLALSCASEDGITDAAIPTDAIPEPADAVGMDASGEGPEDSGAAPGEVDASATPDAGPAGRVRIGSGLTEFNEVPEGGDVELVMGAQGGFHVDLAFELYDLEPADLWLRIRGSDDATGEELTIPVERLLTERRVRRMEDHWLRLGDQAVFRIFEAREAVGRMLRIDIEAEPAEGAIVRATKVVRVVDEE